MKMRTMQGVLCRRRAHAGLALSLVAYTLAFIALILLSQASTNNGTLVAPRLPDHLSQTQLEVERLGEHVESAFHVPRRRSRARTSLWRILRMISRRLSPP